MLSLILAPYTLRHQAAALLDRNFVVSNDIVIEKCISDRRQFDPKPFPPLKLNSFSSFHEQLFTDMIRRLEGRTKRPVNTLSYGLVHLFSMEGHLQYIISSFSPLRD